MALQIRRGLSSERTTIVPFEGELLYTTDEKALYVGDGITSGGTKVSTSATLTGLSDVNITNLQDGDFISYSASSQEWVVRPGVDDHGGLTGLYDNDHPQYRLTADTINFSELGNTGHTHTSSNITDFANATHNVITGTSISGAIQFDIDYTNFTMSEGAISWNSDDGTLQIGMPGGHVNLQVGQEQLIRVRNNSGSDLTNGQIVSIVGSSGNRPTIALASASSGDTNCACAMLTEDIDNNSYGYVTTFGIVRDLDTDLYVEGTMLYLSSITPGAWTPIPPDAPAKRIPIGIVIVQNGTNGVVLFKPQIGNALSDLYDVNGTPASSTNKFLVWNDTTKYWDSDTIDFSDIQNTGHTHSVYALSGDLESHTSDSTIHFTEASIDIANIVSGHTHTESEISDFGDYAERSYFESHTGDSTIHFTQASINISESQISDLGNYAELDSNVSFLDMSATTIYSGGVELSTLFGGGDVTEEQFTSHTANTLIHFTEASIEIANIISGHTHTESEISDLGNYSELDTDVSFLDMSATTIYSGGVDIGEIFLTSGDLSGVTSSEFNAHTGDSTIHFTEDSIDIANIISGHSHYDIHPDISYWDNINSSARLYGGIITSNGDGTVFIASGAGLIKSEEAGPEDVPTDLNSGQGSPLSYVTWSEVSSLPLTDNAYNYIYYDGTADIVTATTDFYSISFTQDFTLGRGYRSGNTVTIRLCGTNAWNYNRRVQLFGEEVFPIVRGTGLLTTESGTRGLSITQGVMWAELVNRFSIPAFDTGTGGTFTTWYTDAGGTWIATTGQSQVDNQNYDGTAAGLVALSNNNYGVRWVYVVHDGSVHVVYGTQNNNTVADALNESVRSTLPGLLSSYATLAARIIIQEGGASFTSVSYPWTTSFASSLAADHGNLAGLLDDDHTQYLNTTRANTWLIGTPLYNSFTSHTADTSIHFTQASISITESQISDLQDYAVTGTNVEFVDLSATTIYSGGVDIATLWGSGGGGDISDAEFAAHTGDSTIHFTEASIDIANIVSGHNHTLSEISDAGSIASYDIWTGSQAEYDLVGTPDPNTLYFISGQSNGDFADLSATTIYSGGVDLATLIGTGGGGDVTTEQFTGHTGDTSIHFTEASIDIANIISAHTHTESEISDLGDYAERSFFESHTGDSTIHFTEASIDIANIVSAHTHSEYLTAIYDSKSVTFRNTRADEDSALMIVTRPITVISAATVSVGTSPSTTWSLRYGADRNASGTEIVGGTSTSVTSIEYFNAGVEISAGNIVWLETSATGGTQVDEMHFTMSYSGV